jgi:hypothetical protein
MDVWHLVGERIGSREIRVGYPELGVPSLNFVFSLLEILHGRISEIQALDSFMPLQTLNTLQ